MSMKTETTCAAVAVQEKRRERRYPTNDPVQVRTYPYTGVPVPANVVDVSRSGMKLELVTALARGARIEVLMASSNLAIFGEVRYCRKAGAMYHAGVLIEDVVQPRSNTTKHVHGDEILLYIAGKGSNGGGSYFASSNTSHDCAACKRLRMADARESSTSDGARKLTQLSRMSPMGLLRHDGRSIVAPTFGQEDRMSKTTAIATLVVFVIIGIVGYLVIR